MKNATGRSNIPLLGLRNVLGHQVVGIRTDHTQEYGQYEYFLNFFEDQYLSIDEILSRTKNVIKREIIQIDDYQWVILYSEAEEYDQKVVTIIALLDNINFVNGQYPTDTDEKCSLGGVLRVEATLEGAPEGDSIPYENTVKQILSTVEIEDCSTFPIPW